MAETLLKIDGMSCMHCVGRVKKAIESLKGIASAGVEVGSARVTYDASALKPEDIAAAVVKAGYKVTAQS